MKIIVTARQASLESEVDPRFGRAAHFVVVDIETGEFKGVDNTQNLNAVQGAGVQAAQNALEQGIEAVLTGHCGPKAFSVLTQGKVKVYTGITGTVAAAVEQFKSGTLQAVNKPDVAGHWQ